MSLYNAQARRDLQARVPFSSLSYAILQIKNAQEGRIFSGWSENLANRCRHRSNDR